MFTIRKPIFNRRFFSAVAKNMEKHGVVPDVLDVAPTQFVKVKYPSGVEVNLGNQLTPTQVKDPPVVKWTARNKYLYTLCMTDPDAPSRKDPQFREWHHWLVGNIPGCRVSEGETLSKYIGSGPPKGTGLHRYVFIVYQQKEKLVFKEPLLTDISAEKRGKFSIKRFAAKYKLGHPIAGNFFQAEWDEYVSILYRQLGA